MMKCRKISTILVTFMVMLSMNFNHILAKEYDYTVTFYAGNHGSFESTDVVQVNSSTAQVSLSADGKKITVSQLKAKDRVGLSQFSSIALENEKYYMRGIRQSGRDNNTVDKSSFEVNGDMDYVVAYGIRGNLTTYTVHYQDKDGNELSPSMTYYGNVGDKPVIAYLYIEGYEPQTYNLTKTLVKNEAENELVFIYNQTRNIVVSNFDNNTNVSPATPGISTTAPTAVAPVAGVSDNNNQTPMTQGVTDDDVEDLDENQTPLSKGEDNSQTTKHLLYLYGPIGIAAIAVFGLISLYIYMRKNKKKQI